MGGVTDGGFETYEPAAQSMPLRGDFGQLMATEAGKLRDQELELLHTAMLCRLPSRCPDDALDALGAHFKIERYPAEGNDSYRGRLTAAWATWEEAGTPKAIEDQLRAYGFNDVVVYRDDEGHWFQGEWYSRFLVVLGPDFGTIGLQPLTAPFTTPATGGSTATIAQVRAVKHIILKWKDDRGYPVFVILRFGDVVLGNINSTAPFTPPVDGTACVWDIGKLIVDNIGTAPFVAGGYEV